MRIYAVTEDTDPDKYLNTLGDSPTGVVCTMKQTSHAAAIIAGLMVSTFTNYVTNIVEEDDDRAVPFEQELLLPVLMYKVTMDEKVVANE